MSLKFKYIKWPTDLEKDEMSEFMDARFSLKGAVGIVDGTHLNFNWRPTVDGEVFWTRKCRYSLNAQVFY